MLALCHSNENTDHRVVFQHLEDHCYIVRFQSDYDHQTQTVYTPLRENVESYPSQSGSDVIGTQCPDFGKYSYIHFWWGYGHQMSDTGTPLEEESSGHLSPGTSDVITMQSRDRQIQIAPLQKKLIAISLLTNFMTFNFTFEIQVSFN